MILPYVAQVKEPERTVTLGNFKLNNEVQLVKYSQ